MLVTAKWSIDDYHRIVESGVLNQRRVELLDGDIIEMAPEGGPHAYCSDEAGEYLMYLLGDRAKVRHAKPITLHDSTSEPEPDIAIVQLLGRDYRQHHPYAENVYWLIEYANSSLDKDLTIKTKLYARAQIPEHWVLNLKTMEVIVWRSPNVSEGNEPTEAGYGSQLILTQGTITPLAFPDVEVEVQRLLNP